LPDFPLRLSPQRQDDLQRGKIKSFNPKVGGIPSFNNLINPQDASSLFSFAYWDDDRKAITMLAGQDNIISKSQLIFMVLLVNNKSG